VADIRRIPQTTDQAGIALISPSQLYVVEPYEQI